MIKRKRLGFVYLWDKNWMGGKYYAQNLFIALNTLPEEQKPLINVYCQDDSVFYDLKENSGYPYMEMSKIRISFAKRLIKFLMSQISLKLSLRIAPFSINTYDDVLFPYSIGCNPSKLVYWRPDFQEKYLSAYFSKKDIENRDRGILECCLRRIPIIFSSEDSRNDFKKFFPQYANNPTYVVHFAVSQPDFSGININELKHKYGIEKEYLFCANQFWIHKNHLFLFKAFQKAIKKGMDLQLVCTGRMADDRAPEYVKLLQDFVSNSGLKDRILTLGIIDKMELLCLMKNSYAVIQPSLFEGWNTTVEDCKAMSKFVFVSDIPVHREQISENVCFFNPYDESDLVYKIQNVKPVEKIIDYSKCIERFGNDFNSVMNEIISSAE